MDYFRLPNRPTVHEFRMREKYTFRLRSPKKYLLTNKFSVL